MAIAIARPAVRVARRRLRVERRIGDALTWLGERTLVVSAAVFVGAWIGQFVGHAIERSRPSFLEDLRSFLVGPAWLLGFVYRRLGIAY